MISFPFFFLSIFVFCILTVAWVGLLFDELSFLWLAALNFIVFLLFWLIYVLVRRPAHSKKIEKTQDVSPIEELLDDDVSSRDADSKKSHYVQAQQFVKYNYRHKKSKKHSIAWVVALLGFISAIFLWLNRDSLTSVSNSTDKSLTWYAESILSGDIDDTQNIASGVIIESTGVVLSTGLSTNANTGIHLDSSFVDTGSVDTNTKVSSSTLKFTDKQSITLLESVVYLLQTHDTPLLTKKDVKFSSVSTTNPYYKYWYTAFKQWLVGQASSASSYVSCQTYFVLKGLLEKRDVQYTSNNVKTQFWAEAKKRDVLNGCVFGTILKWRNLD